MSLTVDQINRRADGLRRHLRIREIDTESRTVEVSFASDTPVSRWFGDEVLEITSEAIDLARMQDGGPVLLDHDRRDHIGVVDSVRIEGGKARARLRFGNGQRASEIWQDISDGIRRHVSVGYTVDKIEVEQRKGQPDLVRVKRWQPLEISIVSIPADPTVGVGRARSERQHDMDGQGTPQGENEENRVEEVLELGRAYNADDLAARILRQGGGREQMQEAILERMNRGGSRPISDAGAIGLSDQESRSFSIIRLARHLANPSPETAREAGFELEASRAFATRVGREPQGAYVPPDVLVQRDFLNTGTASEGGALVATNLLAGNFIDELRNQLAVLQSGASMMSGLIGNVSIPKQTGGGDHQWLPEGGNVDDSKMTLGTVTMSPKTVASSIPMTRRLLLQSSPDIERVVRADLVTRIALAVDAAALNGDDSPDAPTGLRELIEGTALDWEGNLPTFKEMVELETRVRAANAEGRSLGYIYDSGMSGHLKTLPLQSGAPVFVESGDRVNGYGRVRSNQVASGDVFFGNWSDLMIGMWSGLDIRIDTWTLAASDGLVLRAFQDVDVAVRHVEAFALGQIAPSE